MTREQRIDAAVLWAARTAALREDGYRGVMSVLRTLDRHGVGSVAILVRAHFNDFADQPHLSLMRPDVPKYG